MTEQLTPQNERPPKPRRRRRWLRRLLTLAIILALPAAAWLGWYSYAAWSLATEVQSLRDAGEPMDLDDFDRPAIPDEQNAAVLYRQAANDIRRIMDAEKTADDAEGDWRRAYPTPYALREPADALAALEPYRPALVLLREARLRPEMNWGYPLAQFMDDESDFWKDGALINIRRCGDVLSLAAGSEHTSGNDAESLERCSDILAAADAINTIPLMIGELVAASSRNQARMVLEVLAPELQIGEEPGEASREQVRELIRRLLDDTPRSEAFAMAAKGERAFVWHHWTSNTIPREEEWSWARTMRSMEIDDDAGELHRWLVLDVYHPAMSILMKPEGVLRTRNWVGGLSVVANNASSPDCGSLLAKVSQVLDRPAWLDALYAETYWEAIPDMFERWVTIHYESEATLRMAAIALALRMYEIDNGQRPETLAILVPQYIDALPPDPFDFAGGTFRYLPDAGRPRLYSVGADGIDHGGATEFERRQVEDVDDAFFLNGADEASGDPFLALQAQADAAR